MSPLRLDCFHIVYLLLCLVSLHVGSVDGFASVTGSNGSLFIHHGIRSGGIHVYHASKIPYLNHPPLPNVHSARIRRLKKRENLSRAPPRSNSGLNAAFVGNNIQQSIFMGLLHLLLGSLSTPIVAKAISIWYSKIDKPKWTPPNRIFAPTWTILYTFMGIAFSRILQQLKISSLQSLWEHPLIFVWIGHVFLNVIWAPVFFGLQQLRVGLYINCGLLFSLCGIIIPWYSKIDIIAMYMVIPYAIWLLYATCLNRSICLRNPGPYNTARFYSDLYKLQQQAAKYASP